MLFRTPALRVLPLMLLLLGSFPLLSADYFWIGGTGNWSDITHWATTSGGTITHAQAPGPNDDVFFDANSFTAGGQTVTLNTDIIFCRSMAWSGAPNNPTLTGGQEVTINIYGSLDLRASMTYDFAGQVIFTGDRAGNTVDFAGHTAGQTLTFAGGGEWQLTAPVTVDSTLFLNEGGLDTNGETITCGRFFSDTDAGRTLNLGASEITITHNTWRPYPEANAFISLHSLWIDARNLTMNPGTSTVTLTGDQVDLYFEGPGTVDFNELVLSAPMGSSSLNHWPFQNGSGNSPTIIINRLDLWHRTAFTGDFSIGELELHAGQQYRFESGATYSIDGLLATGDCSASIDLSASESGIPANLVSTNAITTEFTSLRDLAASGSGSFTANEVIDQGGNTGWTLNERTISTLFWIGGTGNWNDPTHWATSSGGTSNGCLPSLADDVFFDANSFSAAGQTVTINVENAGCRNMSWADATFNPSFAGPEENRMQLTGSLEFTAAMDHDFEGPYFFTSNALGNTINTAGQRLNLDATFEGGGEWTLADSLYVKYELNLLSGTLRTDDHELNVNFLRTTTEATRGLFLGNSLVIVESRQDRFFYCDFNLNSTNLTFDAGTSIIEFRGGNNGNLNAYGQLPLAFNVVIFYTPRTGLYQSVAQATMVPTFEVDSLLMYNSGVIGGNNAINYCYFEPGRTYELQGGNTQFITELDANGTCEEGHVNILSTYPGQIAMLDLPAGQTFERLNLLETAVTGGAPAVANNSIDGGSNTGWTINANTPRTLYWVDGDGQWFDRAHWSLASGGAGGECVPTAIDDVVFDNNSSAAFFNVENFSDRTVFCHDIDWMADMTNINRLGVGVMRITGSFTNAGMLDFQSYLTYFHGDGVNDQTIAMGGARFYEFVFRSQGVYTLTDDLLGNDIIHQTGTLNFTDQDADLSRIRVNFAEQPKFLNLGSARINLSFESDNFVEALSIYSQSNVTINPGTSVLNLTGFNARVRADHPTSLHEVIFSNPAGNGTILTEMGTMPDVTTAAVTFNGNGTLDTELVTDSLLFAPGKSYVFRADAEQRISEYWRVIGNNCTPISLQSSILGTQATARVPAEAEILANFVQMRDITGTGGNDFLAGARSTDIANSNVGWLFETAPRFETVGFLGEDRTICAGEDVTISAYNFSPGETYLWSDGSTDTTFTTATAGTYTVQVTFQTNCIINDEIVVIDAQDFSIDLPNDPVICAGDTLTLIAETGSNAVDYLWQDGSTEATFHAFAAGEYKVTVDLGGCLKADSTILTVTELPAVDLGNDRVSCTGDDFTLTADVTAESFRWQDGSTNTDFTNDQAGIYWVEAVNGSCPVRDSVEVVYVTPATVELGNDSTVCQADQLVLDATTPGYAYTWQDGSGGATFAAMTTGRYFVEIDTAGCTNSDTINLVFPDLPDVDVADGYEICDGETFELSSMLAADAFRWSNGQTGPQFSTLTGGPFTVMIDFGVCTLEKNFAVDFLAPPVVELGPDVEECEGIPVVLDAGLSGEWQDGSTGPTFTTLADGEYRLVVTQGPCVVADSVRVTFLDAPVFTLGEDQLACLGDNITIATSPPDIGISETVRWDDGVINILQREFTDAGTVWVEVENADGCLARDSVELAFSVPPLLNLGPDTTGCDDRPMILTPMAGVGTLSWPDGSTGPSYRVPDPGTFLATLTDSVCTVTDTITVDFEECIDFKAYLPNAFSPNFDGINDEFGPQFNPRIEILAYELEVFDRWGALVFRSEDPAFTWDGLIDGRARVMGVYVYSLALTYRDDRGVGDTVIGGDVMVVR